MAVTTTRKSAARIEAMFGKVFAELHALQATVATPAPKPAYKPVTIPAPKPAAKPKAETKPKAKPAPAPAPAKVEAPKPLEPIAGYAPTDPITPALAKKVGVTLDTTSMRSNVETRALVRIKAAGALNIKKAAYVQRDHCIVASCLRPDYYGNDLRQYVIALAWIFGIDLKAAGKPKVAMKNGRITGITVGSIHATVKVSETTLNEYFNARISL